MRKTDYDDPVISVIKSIRWKGMTWRDIQIHRKDANGQILFGLRGNSQWLVMDAIEDWSQHFDEHPELEPKATCFWIKSDGKTKGLGRALHQAYVVEPTGRVLSYGPFFGLATEYYFIDRFSLMNVGRVPMQLRLDLRLSSGEVV